MIITLYGNEYEVHGYPVIDGQVTRAFATDQDDNVYVLFWPVGKEPIQGNVNVVRLENPPES